MTARWAFTCKATNEMEETWVCEILTFGAALHPEGSRGGTHSALKGEKLFGVGVTCGFCLFWSLLDSPGAPSPCGVLPCGICFNPYSHLAQ